MLFIFVLMIGLMVSKFMMSLGMFGLIGVALITTDLKAGFQNFLRNKAYVWTTGVFGIILVTGLYTENWGELLVRLRIALPFLSLPIVFACLPSFTKRQYHSLLYIFVLLTLVFSVGMFVNFMNNYEELSAGLTLSKAIPAPNEDHIRFSLMLCIAIFAAGQLFLKKFYWKYKWERPLLGIITLILVILMHIFSVRSGLLAFYVGLLAWLVHVVVTKRKYVLGLIGLLLLIAMPYITYQLVPSVRAKVGLTIHNISVYQKGEIGHYSDTQRFLSYDIAWDVIQENFWWGVGMGDLRDEIQLVYFLEYPQHKFMFPHNQFLTFWGGCGLVGLVLFLICFFVPLIYRKHYRNAFILIFYVIIFTSFLTENTILNATGTAIHTLFLLLALNYLDGQYQEKVLLEGKNS
ncbi:MAG: O-antigen ligase family protein [Aureispira sp.]|nr:O-antigen ligase family protein [Aureispira sp.]